MSWHVPWLLCLLGCGAEGVEPSGPIGPSAVPVHTWVAVTAELEHQAAWTGVVRGAQQATVLSEAPGRVTALPVQVGRAVPLGGTLVRLEDGRQAIGVQAAEAALARAQAAAQAAARQAERVEALGDGVPRSDHEDAATRVALARADLLAAEAQRDARARDLADTRVRAPFAGRVTRLHVDLGQVLGAGTPVATVVDTSQVRVRIGVPTDDLAGLAQGSVADVGGRPCVVDRIDRQVDPASGLVQVEVACDADERLIIGAPVTVSLALGQDRPTLAVPLEAVVERFGVSLIYVVQDGVARARTVTPARRTDSRVQLLSGLAEGEVVVVSGAERLTDGVPVQVR